MDVFDRLRQFDILSHFDDRQLEHLAGCTSRVRYTNGSAVVREGDESRDLFFIDVGEILIQRKTPYGRYTLAHLESGDTFGEASFLDREARSGDALVAADSVLFPLNARHLASLFERDSKLELALHWTLWKSLSKKLRRTNESLAQFFSKGPGSIPDQGPRGTPEGEIRVGLQTKQKLFREQTLSPMEINFLATLSKEQEIAPGGNLFHEGEEGDRMYVVLEGRVMISKKIAGAGEEALAFLERGDYFGEMALIDRQPRSADARAGDKGAVVLSISREVLEGILDIQKVSSIRLLRLLCRMIAKRLREIDDKLVGWHIFDAGAGDSILTQKS